MRIGFWLSLYTFGHSSDHWAIRLDIYRVLWDFETYDSPWNYKKHA